MAFLTSFSSARKKISAQVSNKNILFSQKSVQRSNQIGKSAKLSTKKSFSRKGSRFPSNKKSFSRFKPLRKKTTSQRNFWWLRGRHTRRMFFKYWKNKTSHRHNHM